MGLFWSDRISRFQHRILCERSLRCTSSRALSITARASLKLHDSTDCEKGVTCDSGNHGLTCSKFLIVRSRRVPGTATRISLSRQYACQIFLVCNVLACCLIVLGCVRCSWKQIWPRFAVPLDNGCVCDTSAIWKRIRSNSCVQSLNARSTSFASIAS